MAEDRVSGWLHLGRWYDIGTPQRLEDLDDWLAGRSDWPETAKRTEPMQIGR
jgi:NDP-sugar pyrophosphorylase family protein